MPERSLGSRCEYCWKSGGDFAAHPSVRLHAECAARLHRELENRRRGRPAVVPPPMSEGRADFVAAAAAGPRETAIDGKMPPGEDPVDAADRKLEWWLARTAKRNRRIGAIALRATYGEKEAKRILRGENEPGG